MIDLSVVIPAFNEQEVLKLTMDSTLNYLIENFHNDFEVIIINDGSHDNTYEILKQYELNSKYVIVKSHMVNLGLGAALRTGFRSAKGKFVGWLPADNQFTIQCLHDLYKNINGNEIILGNIDKKERIEKDNLWRMLLSSLYRFFLKLVINLDLELNGILLFRNDILKNIELISNTGQVSFELVMKAKVKGYKISSLLINLNPRVAGVSKVNNIRSMLISFWELFKLRAECKKIK